MKFAIYGGSFDPVHCGHLLVARAAIEELHLDRLYFVPAAQSPFKPERTPTPAAERVRLLRLALAGETRWEIDDFEIRRGGVSYTIDTVRAFRERAPEAEWFVLIGGDHVATLPQWREAAELARQVEFVVIPRPGQVIPPWPAPFRGRQLRGFPLELSSSTIRDRLRTGQSIAGLVPTEVAEAIRNYRLYLSA